MKNNKTNSPPPPPEKVVQLKIKLIIPAVGNREDGSGLDVKSIRELADTIIEHGIVQPLTVRTHPAKKNHYELICGERRWRAAELAKLEEAPCIVRECDDATAIEIRAIENLQREGISELEEAKNYQQLLALRDDQQEPLHTYDTIAQRIGKSPVFVRARCKLLLMPDLAKLALQQGKLNASVALLICRIPDPKLAHKATLEVLTQYGNNTDEEAALNDEMEPMSYRRAKAHIQQKYMVRLKGCGFDQENADLVPVYYEVSETGNQERAGGGKCSDCPFRTGNMKKTFPDAESADVCTHPTCFKAKKTAQDRNDAAKFKEKGQRLLKDGQARRILTYDGDAVAQNSGYVDLREKVPGKNSKKTWEEALAGHLPEGVVPEVARGKKNFLVLPAEVVAEAAKAAGLKVEVPVEESSEMTHEQMQAARALKIQQVTPIVEAAAGQIIGLVKKEDTKSFLCYFAQETISHAYCKRHNLNREDKSFAKHFAGMSEAELRCALAESVFLDRPISWEGKIENGFAEICEHYGVDLKAIAKEQKAKVGHTPELPLKKKD